MTKSLPWTLAAFLIAAAVPPASAQWNPAAGQYGKTATTDVRVMTWNIADAFCTTNPKVSGANNWTALARIVAAMKPDILICQECGDNDGNGTGSGLDTVAELTTVMQLFVNGGNDPFIAGSPAVTAYVRLYAPSVSFPYIFVSSDNDGFNRNLILSRYPFADVNGDTRSTYSDIPTVSPHLYTPGGDGGIRGCLVAEIDLPGTVYAGDVVVTNCHLKAGGASSDHAQRVTAAQNIAYFIDHFYNGGGLGVPDPFARIADSPAAAFLPNPNTAVISGGDWNEDEAATPTVRGPAAWITQAQNPDASGGTDGTDRNRSDMTWDASQSLFSGTTGTFGTGSSKYDHIAWQDSVVALRRSFIFKSSVVTPASAMPPELAGYASPSGSSATASDHLPVIADFIFPGILGCNTAGQDLGFAKLGGNGRFPRFSACGGLATGQQATLQLLECSPNALAYAGLGATTTMLNVAGGTILPAPLTVVGPFLTDATGALSLTIPGGGGPTSAVIQWGIVDAGANSGISFSNGLRLQFLP